MSPGAGYLDVQGVLEGLGLIGYWGLTRIAWLWEALQPGEAIQKVVDHVEDRRRAW